MHPSVLPFTLAALSAAAFAQNPGPGVAPPGSTEPAVAPDGVPTLLDLEAFQREAGRGWQLRRDRDTGWVRFLFGGALEPSVRPVGDDEVFAAAEEFVQLSEPLHGIEQAVLRRDRVVLLPLSIANSSDKLTARFVQEVDGVPVRAGTVNVLMDLDGRFLSLDTTGLPRLAGFDVRPSVPAADALEAARRLLRAEFGVFPTRVRGPELVIDQVPVDKTRRPELVWEVEVLYEEPGYQPHGQIYRFAAKGSPYLVSRDELIHEFDVYGNVSALVSPGLLPDVAYNPEAAEGMPFLEFSTPVGTITTDVDGDFSIPGVDTPLSATFTFYGTYADADNDPGFGADYSLAVTLQPNTQNDVLMNPSPSELTTAQANAYARINEQRLWLKSVNPADTTLDFRAEALVNQTWAACNATFDGVKTNYFQVFDNCVNSAYSTVVFHEMGHFLNQLYGSFNASDGFGEGMADVWAVYASDQPVVGQDFSSPGGFIRTAENSSMFCGDDNQGCQGQTHANGQPLVAAFWNVRERFNAALGDAAGDMAADVLLNAWMNAYDDGQVLNIIVEHLLVLDDDNGDLNDGTPNFDLINGGFVEQGFPGYQFTYVNFDDVVDVEDSLDENGPYGVSAELTSAMGSTITSAVLVYRVDGGSFLPTAMTNLSGDLYTGLIPGVSSPAHVEYYLLAQDGLGNTQTYPRDVADELLEFRVAERTVYYADSFDGPTDNGWTHVETATQDDWQRDVPQGKLGQSGGISWTDPPAAFSPPYCWGNDLGISGFNGAYQPEVDNSLFSPVIDLSAASDARLAFKRWLTVERGQFDSATIAVNGNQVYSNAFQPHTVDTEWTDALVDISAIADGNPSVQLEFRLQSDAGLHLGGWAIDDVEIVSFDAVDTACLPSPYGTGLAGSQGVPSLDSAGQPSRVGNADFRIKLKNGEPASVALIVVGFSQTSVPFLGGDLLVVPFASFLRLTDVFGQTELGIAIDGDPSQVGVQAFWQAFVSDASTAEGFSITPGLAMTVCN